MEVSYSNNSNEVFDGFLKGLFAIPGVKVNREKFLKETLAKYTTKFDLIEKAVEIGTVKAGFSRQTLDLVAKKIMSENVLDSTKFSFLAGIPGGFTMVATIPADTAQFYAHALILAQKLAYLYGYDELWNSDDDYEYAKNQMLLFLGVMFGVSGSTATLKVVTSNLSSNALKKLPQMTLTKTFYYPIIKKIAKAMGIKITKQSFAKGVSKAIPVLGGVISGGITFASLSNMGEKLRKTLSEGISDIYLETDFSIDVQKILEENAKSVDSTSDEFDCDVTDIEGENFEQKNSKTSVINKIEQIGKLNQLKEMNAITNEEFNLLKAQIIDENEN